MSEKNRQLLQNMYSGEIDYLAQLAEDAVWKTPFETFRGKQKIVKELFSKIENPGPPPHANRAESIDAC